MSGSGQAAKCERQREDSFVQGLRAALTEHLHAIIVVTLLTLALTFPTIAHVFRTDVFWLPVGPNSGESHDLYVHLWDIWYGKQILTGQADLFYTDLIFYPEGVSLVNHPQFLPLSVFVNLLLAVMPLSNAYCLSFLLIIISSALAAYVYLHWLFQDKWLALLGAIVFGLSPQVVGYPYWPSVAWIAPIALALYCFHRGICEKRAGLIALAGLWTGLHTLTVLYNYVVVVIMLAFFICALGASRWRDRVFWRHVALLVLTIAISSAWLLIPMLQAREAFGESLNYYSFGEYGNDILSFFSSHKNPIYGPLAYQLGIPYETSANKSSFLGFLPLALIGIGLFNIGVRRRMLTWLGLFLALLILCLGSTLHINGVEYEDILLPKHFLNQLAPTVFAPFATTDLFMPGARLPLAVLTCFGVIALRQRYPRAGKPWVILVFSMIVAVEYHIPISPEPEFPIVGSRFTEERRAFVDWLAGQDEDDIRLINLPFGRDNSKIYLFYQSLHGFPQTDGAISRPPDSAFDYMRRNPVLSIWQENRPTNCVIQDADSYRAGLSQLLEDGYSHIVHHHGFYFWKTISDSFRYVEPAYSDAYVSIYRLDDLRESCPEAYIAGHPFTRAYADALQKHSIIDERQGAIVVFPPTVEAGEQFMRYVRLFGEIDKPVVAVASNERGSIEILSSESPSAGSASALTEQSAVWLVNELAEFNARETEAYQEWFTKRYRFCRRVEEGEGRTIELYLKSEFPCSAMDESNAVEIHYDGGLRLHKLSYDVKSDVARFFLEWGHQTRDIFSFSLQFFDKDGRKALQVDKVIQRDLLEVHEIDIAPLVKGLYSAQLIVYDFETKASLGGTIANKSKRFMRELEIAKINVER